MTPIQELVEKYRHHLNNDSDLDEISGRQILRIVLVDLISYQIKERDAIVEACKHGFRVDAEDDDWTSDEEKASEYYQMLRG